MDKQNQGPLEGEFRSSQLYRTLRGIPGGDAIAEGLGSAAESLDTALNGVGSTVQRGVDAAQRSVQAATHGPQSSGPNNTTYHYSYVRPTGPQQTNRQKAQAARAAQQAQQQAQQTRQANAGFQQRQAPQQNLKLVKKGSKAKFYVTGAAALLFAANFPLYEPIHYAIFGVFLAGVYLLSSKLFQGKSEWVPANQAAESPKQAKKNQEKKPEQKAEQPKPSQTGNPEVDKIINDGNRYLKQLRAANDAIPEEALSEDIDRMEKASADIFAFIAEHPQKAGEIRKFMNYYLPTTLKLLNSYQRLSRQSAKGENITSTMFNIAGMMHTVADAFEKQLDSLFTDEAMDVSADISVFETLLKQEGFVEEPVKKTQKQTNGKDEQP